jgi:hypothetical protein
LIPTILGNRDENSTRTNKMIKPLDILRYRRKNVYTTKFPTIPINEGWTYPCKGAGVLYPILLLNSELLTNTYLIKLTLL